ELGRKALNALNAKEFPQLRRLMAKVHLETYDNLRDLVLHHVKNGPILNPIVEAVRGSERAYLQSLLAPTFGEQSAEIWSSMAVDLEGKSPKKIEDAMRAAILLHLLPDTKLSVPLFRAIADRLVSLRLLNIMRVAQGDSEFAKSYSPCVQNTSRP